MSNVQTRVALTVDEWREVRAAAARKGVTIPQYIAALVRADLNEEGK